MDERAQIIDDFQATFSTPHGQRVYEMLKKKCHYDVEVDCDDGMILSQITGMRNVFVFIKNWMEADPNEKIQTETENAADEEGA